jgi:hypothetical protein
VEKNYAAWGGDIQGVEKHEINVNYRHCTRLKMKDNVWKTLICRRIINIWDVRPCTLVDDDTRPANCMA